MHLAITGATGFLGRYIVNHLTAQGHRCRCWARAQSDRGGFDNEAAIDKGGGAAFQPRDAIPSPQHGQGAERLQPSSMLIDLALGEDNSLPYGPSGSAFPLVEFLR